MLHHSGGRRGVEWRSQQGDWDSTVSKRGDETVEGTFLGTKKKVFPGVSDHLYQMQLIHSVR